jgi:hypothetical protein
MAVTLNASTTAGLVQTADTSGVLALQTAGTTALTVGATQLVSIGTASPSASYGLLTVAGPGISITPDTSSKFQIGRYSAGAPYSYIKMGSTSSGFKFTDPTDSFDLMTLSSTGALALYGASTSANGVGITFPATQSASTNANTLDDYEEGTWTPATVNYTGSITNVSATYIKIGRLVTIQLYFVTSDDVASSGTFSITGLPFLSETTANNYSTFPTFNFNNPNATAISGAQILPNVTSIRMLKKTLATSPTWSDWIGSDVNSGEINMTFTYQSNS